MRLTYRVQGASFTVRDPALEYVEGGFHALTNVQGPGATESEMSPPYEELPALPVRILALSLLASVVGALAALLCAAGAAVRSLWGARKG